MNNKKFVTIEIELDNNSILELCLEAHNQDITLNKLVNNLLTKYIKERKNAISKRNK